MNNKIENDIDKCPLFEACCNKLKDDHCDDQMSAEMYCFKNKEE